MANKPVHRLKKEAMDGRVLPKVKKTFTLSAQAVSYLAETHRVTQKPVSEIIEEIILEKLQPEHRRLSAAITGYYDSLSQEQVHEEWAWAKFTESGMGE